MSFCRLGDLKWSNERQLSAFKNTNGDDENEKKKKLDQQKYYPPKCQWDAGLYMVYAYFMLLHDWNARHLTFPKIYGEKIYFGWNV